MSNKLSIDNVSPSSLQPSKWNPNIVSPDNEARLEESLKRNGFFKPALVRELSDGSLEIIGGEHRVLAASRLGYEKVPVINLGKISDSKAKELCLLDNGRYGSDDTLQLAELLESLGSADELANYMPYSETDIASIFSSINIALDDLDLPDDAEVPPSGLGEKPLQSHQVMRFKIPVDDVATITAQIESAMKTQKFTESDSLSNAGDALVYLLTRHAKG